MQLQATLINCFVQPVGDSISEVVDGKPGIYTALAEAAETMRRGGGVGYDFLLDPAQGRRGEARARARAARCPTCACSTAPARRWNRRAARRGAQMGALRCDHPTSRNSRTPRTRATSPTSTFGGVTDEFHERREDLAFELVHKSKPRPGDGVYQRPTASGSTALRARDLWDQVMRSTYDHAEPGILFLTA